MPLRTCPVAFFALVPTSCLSCFAEGSTFARALEEVVNMKLCVGDSKLVPTATYGGNAMHRASELIDRRNGSEKLRPVSVTYDVRQRVWVLLEEYAIVWDGTTIRAHAGYEYDLSSVPRALWSLVAPNELSLVAPLFHDLLYEYRGRLPSEWHAEPFRTFSRREADALFLDLLKAEGVAPWRARAAYAAVRVAGGVAWYT